MSKKESYWFSHDSNAASEPKMVALIRKYGFEGYGHWWRLQERLRESKDYRYDISVPFAWEVIGEDLHLSAEKAEAFVRECIDYFKLLQCDGQYFWSEDLGERMEFWERRREVLRERGRKGGKARGKKKNDNEDTDNSDEDNNEAQAKQQLSTGLSTSNTQPEHKQANETKQNETKQNETTDIQAGQHPKPLEGLTDDNDVEGVLEKEEQSIAERDNIFSQLRRRALADDQRFVYPYVSAGRVNKEQLGEWLSAFNKWLQFTGEQVKEERDYRRHFASWFKYRDVRKETPGTYNPAAGVVHTPEQKTISAPKMKTVPLPVAMPADKPQGKFSKGDNRYDMHWLRGVRDEVRSMGG